MQKEAIAVQHNVVDIGPFYDAALAASQTNAQLLLAETAAIEWSAPCAGSCVYISGTLSAAGTAGNLSVGVTINGTENASTTQAVTTGTQFYAQFPRDLVTFSAGAKIGVEITTDGDWTAETMDLTVHVGVLLWDMTF